MLSLSLLALPASFLPRKRTAIDGSHARLQYHEGSEDLLVLFASRNTQQFQFLHTFLNMKVNKLFLIDRTGFSWYQEGIPGFADDLTGIADRIKELKRLNRFKTITCFGASMGAYAAITVGAMAGVDRVVAISPQIKLNRGWNYTPPDTVEIRPSSTIDMVKSARSTKFEVLTSSEPLDVYHANLISSLKNVNVAISRSSHNILRSWKINGILKPSVESLVAGAPVTSFSDVTVSTADIGGRLETFLDLYYRREFEDAASLGRQILQFNPNWCDANAMVGLCYFNIKRFSLAIPYLERAHAIDSMNASVYPALIASYLTQDVRHKADALLAEYVGVLEADEEKVSDALDKLASTTFGVGAYEFCAQLRDTLRRKYRRDTVLNLYMMGRSWISCGQTVKAKECFQGVVSRERELSETQSWMAERSKERLQKLGAMLLAICGLAVEWIEIAVALA